MSLDSAHKNRWTIAEVVFGLPFLSSIAIHWIVPLSLPRGTLSLALIPAGMLLILTGIGFIILARREFAHHVQPTDPGQPTHKIIRTGVFALSRNPLYLGSGMVFLGIAFTSNLLWALATLALSVVLCHHLLILPEERYLRAKFGEEYKAYTASTQRWFGRK